jgi:putative ABC transport system ATP-binding protein
MSADLEGPLLAIAGLTRRFRTDRPPVLENLSLTLARGEYLAVLGESGVGKSTLLNLIAGLETADGGSIQLLGEELVGKDDDALTLLRRLRMGFVFQAFHVLPYLSVARNVALPLALLGVSAPEASARVEAMLAAVGLAGQGMRSPRELSGGELQRVAIARALVHRPQLVLADEPTGNLDPTTAAQVLAVLREELRASGGGGILVTHSRAAAATADRACLLDGRALRPIARG